MVLVFYRCHIIDATLPHDTEMQEKLFNMVNKYDKFIEVLDLYEREKACGWH
jgi:hypothetical protein